MDAIGVSSAGGARVSVSGSEGSPVVSGEAGDVVIVSATSGVGVVIGAAIVGSVTSLSRMSTLQYRP